MANDNKTAGDGDSQFSVGVREMRRAGRVSSLALDETPQKSRNTAGGFDPYNTSGSFDRKKNWSRVGKR